MSQEAGKVVWYSHLLKNFPQFVVIHTVKGFGIVNTAEADVSLELSCFFDDPAGVGNLTSGSSAFYKSSVNIWKFMVHVQLNYWVERDKTVKNPVVVGLELKVSMWSWGSQYRRIKEQTQMSMDVCITCTHIFLNSHHWDDLGAQEGTPGSHWASLSHQIVMVTVYNTTCVNH